MELQYFESSTPAADIAGATFRDGASVVTNIVDDGVVEAVANELRENLDHFGYRSQRAFSGFKTNRCSSTFVDAPSSVPLAAHNLIM